MSERLKRLTPVAVCGVAGLVLSIVIESVHRQLVADQSYASFCNVNSSVNCDVVLTSRYALLFGFAVSTWSILFHACILGLVAGIAVTRSARNRESLAGLLVLASVWGFAFSVYMAGIAFFALHTVCLMCSGLYVVSTALVVTAWWLRGQLRGPRHRSDAHVVRRDRLVLGGGVIAIIALVLIAGIQVLGGGVRELSAEDIARTRPDFYRSYLALPVVRTEIDSGHSRGNPNAPVTIVEFSDFECGHCAAFHETLEDALPRLGQMVRVVFRHFPLDSSCNPTITGRLHSEACLAAVASECAGEQNKFWQYHDLLFQNQRQLGRQFLLSYASRLGLDIPRFTACLGGAEARARVENDARAGAALGIDSTPTVFINGRTVKGALDAQGLSDAVTLTRANVTQP